MKKKAIFICQIAGNILKVITCEISGQSKCRVTGLETIGLEPEAGDKALSDAFAEAFKKLNYSGNPVIVCLARSQATVRYLKIPSTSSQEIDRMVTLQAPHYLPYPVDELVTGYEIVSTDKAGYSYVLLVICHRSIIERYLAVLKELKIIPSDIALSSFGLCNLFILLRPEQTHSSIIAEVEREEVELAIISNKKLLSSRSFKLNRSEPNWADVFIDELHRTLDIFSKEVEREKPGQLIILNTGALSEETFKNIKERIDIPLETLFCAGKISLEDDVLKKCLDSGASLASMVGLAIKERTKSATLLPQEIKEGAQKFTLRKTKIQVSILIGGCLLMLGLATAKHLDNKALYIKHLKSEVQKIADEAKPLEMIERRLSYVSGKTQDKPSCAELLRELHTVVPQGVQLTYVSYEKASQLILRGQTQELNSVFSLASTIESSDIFKKFSAKVKYATKRKTQAGEIIDFEVNCIKKK